MSYNVKDVVHINLSLPLYVTEIIRTNEFQRLRNLKQLGELMTAIMMQKFL